MKNKFLYIAAASMAVLAAGACQKESRTEEVPVTATEEVIANPVVIRAALDADETKATVSSAGNFAWTASTDRVAYHTTDGYVVSSGASETGASTEFTVDGNKTRDAFAIFPSTIVAADATNYGQESTTLDVTLPGTYTLDQVMGTNTPCPMIAPSNADAWSFSQLCGLIRMTVNSIPPSATKLTVDFHGNKVQGAFSIASPVTPGTSSIVTSDTDGDDDIITITFDADGTSWRDGIDINLPIPTGDYTKVTVKAYNNSDPRPLLSVTRKVKIGEDSYTLARAAGKKLTASLPAFSISDTKRVAIAKSNLQFTRDAALAGSAWDMNQGTWSFMEYPWSIVETGNVSDNYVNETSISLFGWGATGYNWEANGFTLGTDYGTAYQPWTTSEENTEYGPIFGNAKGVNDLTGVFAPGDFGVAARSDLADDYEWTMGSVDDWAYIFASTPLTISGHRGELVSTHKRYNYLANARILNDDRSIRVYGTIVLPDYFIDPQTNSGTQGPSVAPRTTGGTNEFTLDEWEEMDDAGAILMVAAGYRIGTNVTSPGTAGNGRWAWYQTKTANTASHPYEITSYQIQTDGSGRRSSRPIRLIREIK
ncbi:MAG: hypothetical protein II824_08405 [Bacteroidales bacterium]|nr:hypothetical protein [Bacteroidales bacterium]